MNTREGTCGALCNLATVGQASPACTCVLTCHSNAGGSTGAAATVGGVASVGTKGGWSEAGDFANCGYAMFMSKAAKDAAENVVV